MVRAVRPLRSLSMARGCARIDSRPDIAKIGSADRVEVHHARLLAVIGVRKTFPHGLDPERTSCCFGFGAKIKMCPVQVHPAAEKGNTFGDPNDRVRTFDRLQVSLNIEDQ